MAHNRSVLLPIGCGTDQRASRSLAAQRTGWLISLLAAVQRTIERHRRALLEGGSFDGQLAAAQTDGASTAIVVGHVRIGQQMRLGDCDAREADGRADTAQEAAGDVGWLHNTHADTRAHKVR